MTPYKFRAECIADVKKLQRILAAKRIPVEMQIEEITPGLPDVEVYVKPSGLNIGRLRCCMRLAPDGHVMRQTLNHADCYTGDRDFDV